MSQWSEEPSEGRWEDPATGLACAILRHPRSLHLNAYVGVPIGYLPAGFDDDEMEVHGGVTYRGDRLPRSDDGIRSLVWYGFDCGHYDDLMPGLHKDDLAEGLVYRDWAWVKAETERLAAQLQSAHLNPVTPKHAGSGI